LAKLRQRECISRGPIKDEIGVTIGFKQVAN